jgi:hypothetical protein
MLAAALALTLLDSLSYDLFFVVAFVGFLVVSELTEPVRLTPQWRRRLRWLVPPAVLVFGYVVLREVVATLPEGFVPPFVRDGLLLPVGWLALGGVT